MLDTLIDIRFLLSQRFCLFCILIAAVMGVTGCGVTKLDEAAWRDQRFDVVWPHPPETPRVRLLREIRGPQDIVEQKKSISKRIFEFVSGHQEEYIDFFTPQCIAANGNGLIFIADPSIGLIHKYDVATKTVTYITHAGEIKLANPVGVVLDQDGNLYVTDSQRAAVYKYNSDGEFIKELDGGGRLKRPAGIALNSQGDKYIADIISGTVMIFDRNDKRKGELPGKDFKETLNRPTYVAIDNLDNVYVSDTMNFTIRVFDKNGTYLRSIGQLGDTPGSFARPKGVALDSNRNLYIIDSIFNNFQIFNQQDQLLLYVGQEGDGLGEMMLPSGIYIDKNDRIYVSDTFNHRIQIYQYLKENKANEK